MKKIILILFLLFNFLIKAEEVEAACYNYCSGSIVYNSCEGYVKSCTYGCSAGACKSAPTATPACTKYCDAKCTSGCNYLSCSGGTCKPYCSGSCVCGCTTTSSSGGTCKSKYCDTTTCLKGCSSSSCSGGTCNAYCKASCTYGCTVESSSGGTCASAPTSAPTSKPKVTVTPTLVPCETNDNGVCDNTSDPYCIKTPEACPIVDPDPPTIRTKTVRCSSSGTCFNEKIYCSIQMNIPDVSYGYCPATAATPTPGCQAYACYNAPNSVCPGFNPATTCASSGGKGNCDNCGGVDCGACPGAPTATPGVGPTSTPDSCSCLSTTNVTKAATYCSDTSFLCGTGSSTYCLGSKSCSTPVLDSLTIKNSSGTEVEADSSGRNNICQSEFYSDPNNRRVIFEANLSDGNGWSDISSASIRWNGNTYSLAKISGSGLGGTMAVTIDFTAADNNISTLPIYVNVVDSIGRSSGFVDSGRDWKVWNCQVPVSGTIFDGSAGQACNNTGFTNSASSALNFSSLVYKDISGSNDINMNVSLPSDYGTNNVIFSQNYLPIFNGGSLSTPDGTLVGTGRLTRITDLGDGSIKCPVTIQFSLENEISAYNNYPAAQVDFSYLRDQEGWFQVLGGGIKAKNLIDSGVPATMTQSSRALSLSNTDNDNGLVSYSTFSNINGNNVNTDYGRPNNWWINQSTNDSNSYNYNYFYNNFYIKNGVGMTGAIWQGRPNEGIYFVNGDLNIDENNTLNTNESLMVVVKGKIIIDDNVTNLEGIFVADGNIEADGNVDDQLLINGILYSKSNIRLARSYNDKSLNNSSPAVVVNYRPDLIFNMPGKLMNVLSGWREQ